MLQFLNQSWVGSLFGFSGLIVGIIGIILYRRSKIGPRLGCFLKTLNLISKEKQELPKEVDILYKKRNVSRLSLATVYFWNSGKETIRGEQIVKKDALRLEFEPFDQILKAHIATRTREANQVAVESDPKNPHSIRITFDYFDSNDGVRIEILHTSKLRFPKIKGSIRGIPKGILVASTLNPFLFNRVLDNMKKGKNTFFGTMAILGFGSLILGIFPQSWLIALKNLLRFNEGGSPITTTRVAFIAVGVFYLFMPIKIFLAKRKRYPDCLDIET